MITVANRSNGSVKVSMSFPSNDANCRSRAKQSFVKDANINTIMSRYKKTGLVPTLPEGAFYGDFSRGVDFASAIERIRRAEENFMLLPADVRHRFGNSVANLLDFISDDGNYEECVKLGVRKLDPVKEAAKKAASDAAMAAARAAVEVPKA